MRLTRVYVESDLSLDSEIIIDKSTQHYLVNVLRIKPLDEITLFNGDGNDYLAIVEEVAKKSATLRIKNQIENKTESPIETSLVQAVGKGDRMDYAVQKATELGVNHILPLTTEYSNVRLIGERAAKRRQHWKDVASHAAQQCGRARIPTISPIINFSELLTTPFTPNALKWILTPGEPTSDSAPHAPDHVVICIGPEGGFSSAEIELARKKGFQPKTFGPRILRTETACITALTVIQQQYGDY